MKRVPISLDEKVSARYVRRDNESCWIWEGDTTIDGRPRLNDRLVIRYIFEQEFGPIPKGYALWRDDHTEVCQRGAQCRHTQCVNPHHMRLVRNGGGFAEKWKKDNDAVEGDQEDHDEPADAG